MIIVGFGVAGANVAGLFVGWLDVGNVGFPQASDDEDVSEAEDEDEVVDDDEDDGQDLLPFVDFPLLLLELRLLAVSSDEDPLDEALPPRHESFRLCDDIRVLFL